MQNKKYFLVIAVALVIKFLLFGFATFYVPQSKIMNDSYEYLDTARMLATKGVFAVQDREGEVKFDLNRTPGYPLLLAVLHNLMKIPLAGVVFLQALLTIVVAFITYQVAIRIDEKITILSAVIVLFDLPITIFSLMILTETLFLFLMSLFMLVFVQYLKNAEIKSVVLSALTLALATYVRPISYYLGIIMALFIIYANIRDNFKKAVFHSLIFLAIVYSLLGIWQIRNYMHFSRYTFASIKQTNLESFGLIKSYSKNKDTLVQGTSPFFYYINTTFRCLMSVMTRPGTLKYFRFRALTVFGKILGYPWMVFWMLGFIIGIANIRRNIYYQFILIIILYFILTSIGGVTRLAGERFRVPMVPYIAIISAYGWTTCLHWVKSRKA